jgi:hypothetical protein
MMVFIQFPFDAPRIPRKTLGRLNNPNFKSRHGRCAGVTSIQPPHLPNVHLLGASITASIATCIRKALDMRGRRFTANREFQATLVTVLMALLIMLQLASH